MPSPLGIALLLLSLARAVTAADLDCRAPGADCTLREAAAQAGVLVGSAVTTRPLDDDPAYQPALVREMNSLTPEHHLKWDAIHPAPGVYEFAAADRLVALAEANGMRVRGHTLLWDQLLVDSTPAWVTGMTDPAALRALMAEHIATVVGRYRGRIATWDVVNEPLETGGAVLYDNVFHRLLGPGYIAEALALAHAADPDALLVVNEVLVETSGAKFEALRALAKDLLDQGAPLHGVGLQGHFFLPPAPAELQANIEALAALGLAVEITEIDVLLRGAGDIATKLARQGDDYRAIAAACMAVPACRGLTTWGFTDRYTWINSFVGPGLAPLPLDADYARKPAWTGLRDGILSRLAASRVTGAMLLLRAPAVRPRATRLALRSTDPAVGLGRGAGSPDDPTRHGGMLRVRTAAGDRFDTTYPLAAGGWRQVGRGWVFSGSGPIRRVVVRAGGPLAIRGAGGDLRLSLAGNPDPVDVELTLGAYRVCLRFGGQVRHVAGRHYRATGAGAPAACNGLT